MFSLSDLNPCVDPGISKSQQISPSYPDISSGSLFAFAPKAAIYFAAQGISHILRLPITLEVMKKSFIGFFHFSSIPWIPFITPSIVPTFPALQSVSHPHIVATSTPFEKFPLL